MKIKMKIMVIIMKILLKKINNNNSNDDIKILNEMKGIFIMIENDLMKRVNDLKELMLLYLDIWTLRVLI